VVFVNTTNLIYGHSDLATKVSGRSEKKKMKKSIWYARIFEGLNRARAANREPVAVLMTPKVYQKLEVLNDLYGLPIVIVEEISDFLIIDNRSWAEQEF